MNENKDIFLPGELIFQFPGEQIQTQELDELDDFPGKDDFIKFYVAHNGGSFPYNAWFYPEDCYSEKK